MLCVLVRALCCTHSPRSTVPLHRRSPNGRRAIPHDVTRAAPARQGRASRNARLHADAGAMQHTMAPWRWADKTPRSGTSRTAPPPPPAHPHASLLARASPRHSPARARIRVVTRVCARMRLDTRAHRVSLHVRARACMCARTRTHTSVRVRADLLSAQREELGRLGRQRGHAAPLCTEGGESNRPNCALLHAPPSRGRMPCAHSNMLGSCAHWDDAEQLIRPIRSGALFILRSSRRRRPSRRPDGRPHPSLPQAYRV